MNCPKCGRDVDAQWKFCNYCGESIALACPSCAAINPADALFCHDCGAKFTADAAPMSPWRALNAERQAPARQPITPPSPTFPPPPVHPSPSLACPRCRTTNEPGSAYCYRCGLPLDEEPAAAHAPAPYAQPVGGPPYQSLRTRANWTVGLLITICIIFGLSMLAVLNVFDKAWQAEIGGVTSAIDLEEAFDYFYVLSALFFLAWIGTATAFLMWVFRASGNLQFLQAPGQRFSPGWAVGWWFVPIFHLFRPYQVVAEIWRGSRPDALSRNEVDWKRMSVSPLVGWWWGLYLISNFTYPLIDIDPVFPEVSFGTLLFSVASIALWISSAILAILVVVRVTGYQEAKHRRLMVG